MSDAYSLLRPLLFALDAERSHELTLGLMRRLPQLATLPFGAPPRGEPVELLGLRFANRVGLAAGLDKNGIAIEALGRLGFGFLEVGTVTPRPQPGNPRPRLFRLPAHEALINRMGFNNDGVDALLPRLRRVRETRAYAGVIGVNIGKNFDTPIESALDDYRLGLQKVHALSGYVTVNISSPNTQGLRDLQARAKLSRLLGGLEQTRRRLADAEGRRAPLLLKIAPDVSGEALGEIADTAREHGIDGLIATNTTLARPGLAHEPLAAQAGGLSGAPVRALADDSLRALRARLGPEFALVGVGGITRGEHARDKRAIGANLVQLYSGLIFRGPRLVSDCVEALAAPAAVR